MDAECAPAAALQSAFGQPSRTGRAPARNLDGTRSLVDNLRVAVKLHPHQFWTVYLERALERIEELEGG